MTASSQSPSRWVIAWVGRRISTKITTAVSDSSASGANGLAEWNTRQVSHASSTTIVTCSVRSSTAGRNSARHADPGLL